MKVLRNLVKGMVPMVRYIDEPGGGGGAAAPTITEQMQQSLSSALAGDTVDIKDIPNPDDYVVDKGIGGGGINDDPSAGAGSGAQDLNTPDAWAWNQLKSTLHTEENPFNLPEEIVTGKSKDGKDLTDTDRFNMLVDTIKATNKQDTTTVSDDDDFVADYKLTKKELGDKFDMNEYMQNRSYKANLLKSDAKTFMSVYFAANKNGDGTPKFTQDQITDYISKMNPIELEEKASALKAKVSEQDNLDRSNRLKALQAKDAENFQNWDNNRKVALQQTLVEATKLGDIGGIKLGEAEIKAFEPILDKMTSFNPKTGRLFMDDYLQSNSMNVFKALYLLNMVDNGGMAKHYSDLKQDVKDNVLNKTGIKPNFQGLGSGTPGGMKPPSPNDFVE